MSSNDEDEDVLVGGFALRNLSRCYDEQFGIPFDVSLDVSDGQKVQELQAHKFVLSLHSDVLEEKLRSSVNPTATIALSCEDIEAVKVVIKFCYNIMDPMYNKLNIAKLQVRSG